MAQQFEEAEKALKDPQLQKKYEKERKNFLREITEANKNQLTKRSRVGIPK